MILDDDDNLYSYVYDFPVTHRHTLQNKPNSPGSPSTIEWQGRTVRLGRPFEWNGRTLIVYREVNDEKYGQVLIAALNSSKDYIIGDSVVTDQAIIDYLDDNYGLPVKWRKIKF